MDRQAVKRVVLSAAPPFFAASVIVHTLLPGYLASRFVGAVLRADPAEINGCLAEGLEFKRCPDAGGDEYSFFRGAKAATWPRPLAQYKNPQTLNLKIEKPGFVEWLLGRRKIRIYGRHHYGHFAAGYGGVRYSEGDADEAIVDLGSDNSNTVYYAASWLAEHPRPGAVGPLIERLAHECPSVRDEVLKALRRTALQPLKRRPEWRRWFEENREKTPAEWTAQGRASCLEALESDDLKRRIAAVRTARIIGGMEEEIARALTFPYEAFSTSIRKAEGKYALVIANRSDGPAILAIKESRCNLSYSQKMPPGPPWKFGIAGGMVSCSSSPFLPGEHYLRILDANESRVTEIRLPKGMKPGDYGVRAWVEDKMTGRKYEASFAATVR